MIKRIRESKMIDFDIVFISSVMVFCLIILIAAKIKDINLSITDIHAETVQESTIESSNSLGEIQGTVESSVMLSSGGLINTRYGIGNTPVITTDQMVEWILRKGNELISILQVIAQPLCIVVFIIGCGKALIEALNKIAGSGLLTMIASGIIYACILYAPVLVSSIANFSAN